jgi:hypothetical protein
MEISRQKGVTGYSEGAPTSIARSACGSTGVDPKAVPGTFMVYLVYGKPDRPKSKAIFNLQIQVPAHAGISHNKPK